MTFFKTLVGLFCIAWITKEIALPGGAALLLSRSYMDAVNACDIAMESAWYGSESDTAERLSQDIHLLDCHDYDKLRKQMLFLGLNESYLSWLGLRSLEIHQRPASELAEQHRFIER